MHTATAPAQSLPGAPSPEAITRLVHQGAERRPDLASRLEKAAMIILFRTVELVDAAHHAYPVESEQEPGRFYDVNGACECQDYQRRAPGHWCKHRLAVALVERAADDAERAAREAVIDEWLASAGVRGY